jgi:hypothetical protein
VAPGRGAGALTTNTSTAGRGCLQAGRLLPGAVGLLASLLLASLLLASLLLLLASLLLASLLLLLALASLLLASLLPGWAAGGGVRVLVALVCSACCCC